MKTIHKKGIIKITRRDGIKNYIPFVIFKSKIFGFIPWFTKYFVSEVCDDVHSDKPISKTFVLEEENGYNRSWSNGDIDYALDVLHLAIKNMQQMWKNDNDAKTKKVEKFYL